jgi:ketosteroid isomerase-like protein
MNKPIFFGALLAFILALGVSKPAPAQVDPASLAEQDVAAESRGDVAAALALYSDDAIVQYGGLCWTPCVGKAAVQKEIERRVAAKNHAKIIAKYVSGNVAVVKTEVRVTSIDKSGAGLPVEWSPGVDRIIVWNIYEVAGGKIGVVTLVGQRTDPQTARFIEWLRSWQ